MFEIIKKMIGTNLNEILIKYNLFNYAQFQFDYAQIKQRLTKFPCLCDDQKILLISQWFFKTIIIFHQAC